MIYSVYQKDLPLSMRTFDFLPCLLAFFPLFYRFFHGVASSARTHFLVKEILRLHPGLPQFVEQGFKSPFGKKPAQGLVVARFDSKAFQS
jgi:hypothetical protein